MNIPGPIMKYRDCLLTFALAMGLIAPAAAADVNTKPVYKAKPAPAPQPWNPWQVRLRALGVLPDGSGSTVNVAGAPALSSPNSGLKIGNSVVPELDISYYLTRNWAAELILGVTPHDVTGTGALANLNIGRAWLLPPTLTVQYHFTDFGAFQPYVGAGINYTVFFDQSAGNAPLGALPAITQLKLNSTVGAAVQFGFDYMLDQHWGVNVDAKWLYLEPGYTANDSAALPISGTAHINPWLVGGGLTYRF